MATAACRRIGHISDEQIGDMLAFLGGGARPRLRGDIPCRTSCAEGPVVASGGAPRPRPRRPLTPGIAKSIPRASTRPPQRYFTDYGLGYPYLLAPPWSQIMAYDLNRGVIKWRKPLGQDRDAPRRVARTPACRAVRSARA